MKKWIVYMLRCSDQSLYTGITTDFQERIKKHNTGKASKYTRSRLPAELVWSEKVESESEAKKREAQIKKLTKQEKEKIIRANL